jgi:hypothetical protein
MFRPRGEIRVISLAPGHRARTWTTGATSVRPFDLAWQAGGAPLPGLPSIRIVAW